MAYLTPFVVSLLVALTLLTRIPIPARWMPETISDELRSRSVLWYPWIGLLIGLVLYGTSCVFSHLVFNIGSAMVPSVLVVMVWVWMTGALHLDGLADSVDAAMGSHGDSERTLKIFKDPNAGPMAVVAIVLDLTLKITIVNVLIEHFLCHLLIFVPLVARLCGVMYMVTTRYVRTSGLASGVQLDEYFPHILVSIFAGLVIAWSLSGLMEVLWLLVANVLLCLYWRYMWMKKIGGYTGDCVGGLIELSEVITLVVLLLCLPK